MTDAHGNDIQHCGICVFRCGWCVTWGMRYAHISVIAGLVHSLQEPSESQAGSQVL